MGRSIAAAVVGYIAMVALVILGSTGQWAILGAEGAFQADSTLASTNWAAMSLVAGAIAAVFGGFVASRIDKSPNNRGPKILIGFILVAGIVNAAMQMASEPKLLPDDKSIKDLTFVEAGEYATSPTWFNWLIPMIGAAGAWGGSQIIMSPKESPSEPTAST
ncbi:MAG: hypothetical protein AB8G99_02565 [Planctomycetaceae bacterium]